MQPTLKKTESTEIKPNMAHMFDLADRCIEVAVINTFEDLKKKIPSNN